MCGAAIRSTCTATDLQVPDDYLLAAILIESCIAGNDAVPCHVIKGTAVQRIDTLAKVAAISDIPGSEAVFIHLKLTKEAITV